MSSSKSSASPALHTGISPAAERKLLRLFLENPNIVLTKQQILNRLWDCDGDYIDHNTLTVYIRRLRCKIEDDPSAPQLLRTVRGMGYQWKGSDNG